MIIFSVNNGIYSSKQAELIPDRIGGGKVAVSQKAEDSTSRNPMFVRYLTTIITDIHHITCIVNSDPTPIRVSFGMYNWTKWNSSLSETDDKDESEPVRLAEH